MHLFQCFMYDFMLNVWIMLEEEYKFQFLLVLRIPAMSSVKVHKECVNISPFYLRKT